MFAVNEDLSCHGTEDWWKAARLLLETDESSDCRRKEINGETVSLGGPEGMAIYRIIGEFSYNKSVP